MPKTSLDNTMEYNVFVNFTTFKYSCSWILINRVASCCHETGLYEKLLTTHIKHCIVLISVVWNLRNVDLRSRCCHIAKIL